MTTCKFYLDNAGNRKRQVKYICTRYIGAFLFPTTYVSAYAYSIYNPCIFNVDSDKISQNHVPHHVWRGRMENEPLHEKTCPSGFEYLDIASGSIIRMRESRGGIWGPVPPGN